MRTALITGANRGIGCATAWGLAKQGLRVVMGCRTLAEGEAAAIALSEAGHDARVLEIDVSQPASVEAALAELQRDDIHIDVLVNNAGTYRKGDVLDCSLDDVQASLAVHLYGPLLLAQGLVPAMQKKGYGRVVNVSSGYGSFASGLRGDAPYAISKAALNALTVKLAAEVGDEIKVNSVCPGWVRTRMGGDNADRPVEEGAETPIWLATLPDDGPTGGFFRDREPIPW